jgi:hypothetical protein
VSLRGQRTIEFHDSVIVAIAQEGTSLRLSLDAYVHQWERVAETWKGTGWSQPVQIIMGGATWERLPKLPADLDGGEILADRVAYDNMVPLPLALPEPVMLRLELKRWARARWPWSRRTVETLEVTGQGIAIESTGPGHYVENLPDDFKPT